MSLNLDAIFEQFPILETRRLRLRQITPDDTLALFALFSAEEVTRQTGVDTFKTVEDADKVIEWVARHYEEKRAIRWAITLKEDGIFVGECGYNRFDLRTRRAAIDYHLMRSHWGQGIMTETVRAMVKFGFETVGLNRIEADTMLWNVASMRVLHKLGFREEGIFRERAYWKGEFHDLRMFALLRRDYLAHEGGPP